MLSCIHTNKDKNGNNTQDPDAGYNVKIGSDGKPKTRYGFKAHVNVDEDGFVQAIEFNAGNVRDSQVFTELLNGNEAKVFADSAYASEKNIDNGVLERAYRNKKLNEDMTLRIIAQRPLFTFVSLATKQRRYLRTLALLQESHLARMQLKEDYCTHQ